MSQLSRKATLSLTKRATSVNETFIDCVLHASPEDGFEFPLAKMPALVMEPSRPTVVGWRWDHDPEDPDHLPRSSESSLLVFTYRMDADHEVGWLFPERQSTYAVEAEIDLKGRTVWFPLPTGRCVHSLKGVLGLPSYWPLAELVQDWLFDRTPDTCEISVDFAQTGFTDQGVEVVFNDEDSPDDEYKSMHLMIPRGLLQDPIANGSLDLQDGFNPWNAEQKTEITAFLDPHLPRLISFFETTANSDRETQRFVSGEWEDGLMPFIPAAVLIPLGEDE